MQGEGAGAIMKFEAKKQRSGAAVSPGAQAEGQAAPTSLTAHYDPWVPPFGLQPTVQFDEPTEWFDFGRVGQ